MCGINGLFAFNVAASAPGRGELIATRDAMLRRGPDGQGEWWSEDRRIGLAHRRLAIVDLSDGGAQPMQSADGRYIVTFNGEIYNYRALRAELERDGVVFRSQSDTEILLILYAREGEAMLSRLRGMFAFGIWDRKARRLFLARDPYGIKPLYVSNDGWTFAFASQVKALLAGGRISSAREPAGLVGFHLWGSVPEPFTLYRDIRMLPAGHCQIVDAYGPHPARAFASVARAFADGALEPHPQAVLAAKVREAASDSVKAHLMADVEVGLFLSSGIDSAALLGLMMDAGHKNTTCITLAFEEFRGTQDDEVGLSAEMAASCGARHIVRTVSSAEFKADLPAILDAMDQPTIDGINTWFVAKAAREAGLKVALSGLGGDELLAGYSSFHDIPRWVRLLRAQAVAPALGTILRKGMCASGLAERNPKLPGMAEYGGTFAGAYLLRRGLHLPYELDAMMDPEIARIGLERLAPLRRIGPEGGAPANALAHVAALESQNYMRNQLLRDCDWAGMAHSIEIRTPLVDFGLLKELAPVIPHLTAPGAGKRLLAAAPAAPLPERIVNRRKTGFGVPIGQWLSRKTSDTRAIRGLASRAWGREVLQAFESREQRASALAEAHAA
ncbi:asparagine synthase (glutamine-hydrolyzing) [Bosea sp. 124]|uniref:asparagine synthase (glutamine-hydrolyzing) n=1 Tax=Bosea sp. 124 TaxID=2135642 RepID=UPI000D38DEFA|nr:asparagine synthase (glutamine-hydrolyzing) [Bosea sp. 124]PTM41759.1 asparagine synthase (glutamine-hydrolysing) [Bosea sp. 124]